MGIKNNTREKTKKSKKRSAKYSRPSNFRKKKMTYG